MPYYYGVALTFYNPSLHERHVPLYTSCDAGGTCRLCCIFKLQNFFRKNCLFVESAILWGCAGYFALKYSTRQWAGVEFMPITKLELAPHHGDFAGMCMLYHTHQKRGRAGLPDPAEEVPPPLLLNKPFIFQLFPAEPPATPADRRRVRRGSPARYPAWRPAAPPRQRRG